MGLYCDLLRLPDHAITACAALRDNEEALVRHIQDNATEWLELDKAWHGIHVLLNAGYPHAPFPKGFLFHGGQSWTDRDWAASYGVSVIDLRTCDALELRAIETVLRDIAGRDLLLAYDPDRLRRHNVYPHIWEPRTDWFRWFFARYLRVSTPAHFLVDHFVRMSAFLARGAAAGEGLAIKYHQ